MILFLNLLACMPSVWLPLVEEAMTESTTEDTAAEREFLLGTWWRPQIGGSALDRYLEFLSDGSADYRGYRDGFREEQETFTWIDDDTRVVFGDETCAEGAAYTAEYGHDWLELWPLAEDDCRDREDMLAGSWEWVGF